MTARSADGVVRALAEAAAGGSLSAAFILGRLYDEGWGVKKDDAAAFRWYRVAAEGGLPEAFYFVGSAYAFGSGVRRDKRKGFAWFEKAAAAGDETGAYMVALAIIDGTGVRRDRRRGLARMHAEARRGSRDAMDYLAAHHLEAGRLALARRWAERAIAAGESVMAPVRLKEVEARVAAARKKPQA